MKITLITPCFNGEQHLEPYIKGLLAQKEKDIEYIFVNDGSTDRTKEVILSYEKAFIEKGWSFTYIEQEHLGQASAINKGLKIMTGEFFSCIDSDDILHPDYFSKMSQYLIDNPQVDMVFPKAELVKEKTFEHINYQERVVPPNCIDTLFSDIIESPKNMPAFSTFMIRTATFEKLNPTKQIYEGLSGQNPQFILPIAYNGKVAYLSDCLVKIVIRENSDSNNIKEKLIKRYNWENLYTETLKTIPNMPEYEKAYYFQKIKERWKNHEQYWKEKERIAKEIEEKGERVVKNILGIKIKYRKRKE